MAMAAATARALLKKFSLHFSFPKSPTPEATHLRGSTPSFGTLSQRPKCAQQKDQQNTKRSNSMNLLVKRRTRSGRELDEETFSKHYGNENSAHIPVMLGEVLDVFASVPLSSFVDCTLGAAGHSSAVGSFSWLLNSL